MTKKQLYIIIITLLFLSILYQFYNSKNELKYIYQGLYIDLKSNEILDNRFNFFIKKIFKDIQTIMDFKKGVLVNSDYNSDSLCIYIFHPYKFKNAIKANSFSKKTTSIIKSSYDNFIALSPNVVLIDGKFLGLLILLNYNSMIGFAQSIDFEKLSKNDITFEDIQRAHTFNILDNYLRYGNLEAYREDKVWYSEIDTLLTIWSNVLSWFDSTNVTQGFVPFFIPIVSHEIGHLKFESKNINGWFSLRKYIKNIPSIREEENNADKFANEIIRKNTPDSIYNYKSIIYLQGIIEFAETMRDMVLIEAFEGFRGFHAKDILMYIEEKYPLEEGYKDLPFHHPDRINLAQWRPMPVMTKSEFKEILDKIKRKGSSLTHQHLLLRGYEILQQIDPNKQYFWTPYIFYGFEKLLTTPFTQENALEKIINSLQSDEILILQKDVSLPVTGIGRKYQEVIYKLDKYIQFSDAISYNNVETWIGKGDNFFIEIWGPLDNIRRATLTRDYISYNTEEDKIRDIAIMTRFVFNTIPEIDPEMYLKYHREFMNDFLNGLHPHFNKIISGKLLSINTINATNSFRITVEADRNSLNN